MRLKKTSRSSAHILNRRQRPALSFLFFPVFSALLFSGFKHASAGAWQPLEIFSALILGFLSLWVGGLLLTEVIEKWVYPRQLFKTISRRERISQLQPNESRPRFRLSRTTKPLRLARNKTLPSQPEIQKLRVFPPQAV